MIQFLTGFFPKNQRSKCVKGKRSSKRCPSPMGSYGWLFVIIIDNNLCCLEYTWCMTFLDLCRLQSDNNSTLFLYFFSLLSIVIYEIFLFHYMTLVFAYINAVVLSDVIGYQLMFKLMREKYNKTKICTQVYFSLQTLQVPTFQKWTVVRQSNCDIVQLNNYFFLTV